MSRRRSFRVLGLAALAAAWISAGAATGAPLAAPPALSAKAAAQIAEIVKWKAARTSADRKIDSRLLYALDRAAGRLPAAIAGLEALALDDPEEPAGILLDVDVAKGVPAAAVAARVRGLGGEPLFVSERFASLRARLPASSIRALAGEEGVRRIVPAREAFTHSVPGDAPRAADSGAIVSEGDRVHRADEARDLYALAGVGTKVCALSNGVADLASSQDQGELPAVDVLPGQEGGGDEGTAMLEIVHDLAPGAALGFATAFNGIASFAQNILDLAASGCRVIVDDVIYLEESPFQDSAVAAAVDEVAAAGVLHFSSAGNEGNLADGTSGTWEGDFLPNGTIPPLPGLELHDFGDGGVSNLVLDAAPAVVLHWTDPFAVAANDYDLYILSNDLSTVNRFSNNTQDGVGGDDDPVEIVSFLGSGASVGERIVIARAAGEGRMLNLIAFRGEVEHATGGSLRGHSAAAGAVAVAAAPAGPAYAVGQPHGPYPDPYDATQVSETFSADGPRRIYFDAEGALLPGAPPGDFSASGGVVRAKPDLTAADGVSTSVDGFEIFFGTSAAAPHAAAIAALAMEAMPALDAAEIRLRLESGALDIEAPGVDPVTGHGIVRTVEMLEENAVPLRANLALAEIVPVELAGNGDAVLDPGEIYRLELRLENVGGAGATAVSGVLAADDPSATVLDGDSTWPDLPVSAGAAPLVPFVVRFAPDADCGARLPFTLTVTYAGGIAPESFPFTLVLGAGMTGETRTFSFTGPPVFIPDSPQFGVSGPPVTAELPVEGVEGRVADLDFRIDGDVCSTVPTATTVGISHPFVSNLLLELIAPSGHTVSVVRFADGFGNNFCQTLLDDESAGPPIQGVSTGDQPFTGSFTPARPLSRFDGEEANGVWLLRASDWNRLDTGYLRAFSLIVTPAVCQRVELGATEIPALARPGAALLALFVAFAAVRALSRR